MIEATDLLQKMGKRKFLNFVNGSRPKCATMGEIEKALNDATAPYDENTAPGTIVESCETRLAKWLRAIGVTVVDGEKKT